jgi:GTPase
MRKPLVALVGRQNVGKSTLLNRLAGKQISITHDVPGTTRDRIRADVNWSGIEFTLIDTAGLGMLPDLPISAKVTAQVEAAIVEADLIVFVVDVKAGITPLDLEIAARLRKINKPVILAANKADNLSLERDIIEFYELSLGEPIPFSAYHGKGTAELLDAIISRLPPPEEITEEPVAVKVAIVGRPNVGKSALLNSLLGTQRAIVDGTPGTTRDTLDTLLDFNGQNVLLIDTAGIRRRGHIKAGVEQYSVLRSMRAIDRADIILLVIDAAERVTDQDLHVAGYIQQAFKGVIVIVNKWDLVTEPNNKDWSEYLHDQFNFMSYAPVLFTSAISGQGVGQIMPQVFDVYQERIKRPPTAEVNSVVRQAVAAHGPPKSRVKSLKIKYATQVEISPPTFVFFVNDAKLVHFSYRRYLENKLREYFGFNGTPLKLIFRSRGES